MSKPDGNPETLYQYVECNSVVYLSIDLFRNAQLNPSSLLG